MMFSFPEDARVNDGATRLGGLHHDEADPFEALLKRVKSLSNGDDVGLEALAKAAIEAKISLPRIDKLQRAAIQPTGFALIVIRKSRRSPRQLDRERKAQKQADPSVAAAEEAARLAAIEAEKAAREAERERLRRGCRDLAEDPKLMERLEAVVRRSASSAKLRTLAAHIWSRRLGCSKRMRFRCFVAARLPAAKTFC